MTTTSSSSAGASGTSRRIHGRLDWPKMCTSPPGRITTWANLPSRRHVSRTQSCRHQRVRHHGIFMVLEIDKEYQDGCTRKTSRSRWCGFGSGEDYEPNEQCFAAGVATWGISFLVAFFGHQVWISGVKTLGLSFAGCTWQWRISLRLLVEGIVWSLFYLDFLRGENS